MDVVFNSLPWHDAELRELLIDRRNPGNADDVSLRITWPVGGEATVIFSDCYAISMDFNFVVTAEERILSASIIEKDSGLLKIRERWNLLGVTLNNLRCYHFETSSTGSVMRIYANRFEIRQ